MANCPRCGIKVGMFAFSEYCPECDAIVYKEQHKDQDNNKQKERDALESERKAKALER